MLPSFNQFIAIDWSGARGPRLPGLQVAVCGVGHDPPHLVRPAPERTWSRTAVWEYVTTVARDRGPVLAAFDMGLGLPYIDERAYFPGLPNAPRTARQLWQAIASYSCDAPDFYAGNALKPPSPFAPYFNAPGQRGERFDNGRARLTEWTCRQWTRPSSVFNGVGPGSVGMGSLAGMRLLSRIRKERDLRVAIWPFEKTEGADVVVVEMFPRLYVVQAGLDPRAWREKGFLSNILRAYGTNTGLGHPMIRFFSSGHPELVEGSLSASKCGDSSTSLRFARNDHADLNRKGSLSHDTDRLRGPLSEDEVDALFSAAAIRHSATQRHVWTPPSMTRLAASHEGWIFGVT